MTTRPRLRAPNTLLLVFAIAVLTAGLTWVVPGGSYERGERDGREVVVPGTFRSAPAVPQGPGAVLTAPVRGFVDAAEIIAFVLVVGGAFSVLHATGAVDAAVRRLAAAHDRSRVVRAAWIPLFMLLFSLGGAVFGMSEEVIPFALVFVPLALRLGYDSIVGVAVPYVGAHVGFAAAFLNPFTVGVAQGIAELPPFSGLGYRLVCWVVVTTVGIAFVAWYAHRVAADPERSPAFADDVEKRRRLAAAGAAEATALGRGQVAVLAAFAASMGLLVWGVLARGWYIVEIAGLFLALAIVAALVARLPAGAATDAFVQGARDLAPTALVIALARGILVLARDGRIVDTMLHALSTPIAGLPRVAGAWAMFLVQTAINFFVPSGSGQAALTMPVMAPLADLLHLSRQTAVLAFQLGDGFTNMIIPTSPVLLGVLALGEVRYERWVRWILPLQAVFLLLGCLLLVPPVLFGWP